MFLRCAVLLLYINVARTFEVDNGFNKNFVRDVDARYSLWPSIHNGVRLMRIHKREADAPPPVSLKPNVQPGEQASTQTVIQTPESSVQSGNHSSAQAGAQSNADSAQSSAQTGDKSVAKAATQSPPQPALKTNEQQHQPTIPSVTTQASASPSNANQDNKEAEIPLDNNTVHKSQNGTASDNSTSIVGNATKLHSTATEPANINLSDPGVLKRAFIVFGGFGLLAAAYYFIIYRKRGNTNDAKNTHSSIDPNQFRYGVLQSEDKRSNMELSRVPLTMESDEDEDEDLEIFDLGQKKKSLSYINLEQHDEDIVLNDSRSIDMENLLVDIEDNNSDMINWSGNGSKSIL